MSRALGRTLIGLLSAAASVAGAEALYRAWVPDPNAYRKIIFRFENEQHVPFTSLDPEQLARYQVPVEHSPRTRKAFPPNTTVYLCYEGAPQPYFDEHGCVRLHFNSRGVRDREEVCAPKRPGERRVVCIGDSVTLGWGVREEDAWPRLIEEPLRRRADVRTVNCGFAGTFLPDEYFAGLQHRFHVFEPDVVVLTLCMNDLLAVNGGMAHMNEDALPDDGVRPWWHLRMLHDLIRGPAMAAWLNLDPERDWTQELLDLPPDAAFYEENDGYRTYWAGGGPQQALLDTRDWCRQRGVKYGVVMWPLLQGLNVDEFYPFAKMHDLVAAFCAEHEIPFLDLLPAFKGHNPTTLWVTPADLHGNDVAQRIACGPIAEFVAQLLQKSN